MTTPTLAAPDYLTLATYERRGWLDGYRCGPPPSMSREDAQADLEAATYRCDYCGLTTEPRQYHRERGYGYLLLAICPGCGRCHEV